jgi:putative transposase
MRKRYSATFKAKVVQELMREEKTLASLASEYGVHPNLLRQWKSTVLEGLPSLFQDGTKAEVRAKIEQDRQRDELYAQIGKLATQLAWLKKKSGLNLEESDWL